MRYDLIWNNEIIDSFESRVEAQEMANEYAMAYNGSVAVVEVEDDLYDHDEKEFDDYEDDGQPSLYEEYQDLYGGDDAFESYCEDY